MGALSKEHIKSSVWGREELKMSKREHKEMCFPLRGRGGEMGGVLQMYLNYHTTSPSIPRIRGIVLDRERQASFQSLQVVRPSQRSTQWEGGGRER